MLLLGIDSFLVVTGASRQQNGLATEEGGYADQSEHEQRERHRLLTFASLAENRICAYGDGPHADEHGDHRLDNRRCFIFSSSEVCEPLHDNEHIHVAEQRKQNDQLGNELEAKVYLAREVNQVEPFETDTERHMDYTEDDGNFHLHRVYIGKLV